MTDPAADTSLAPEAPPERPSWRFSGRRGTPVHEREQAPATLPPEIIRSIAEMAREREAAATARSGRTEATTLRLAGDGPATPPVAGAAIPVERRRSTPPSAAVGTTPVDQVPAAPAPAMATSDPVEPATAEPADSAATDDVTQAPPAVEPVVEPTAAPPPAPAPAAEAAPRPAPVDPSRPPAEVDAPARTDVAARADSPDRQEQPSEPAPAARPVSESTVWKVATSRPDPIAGLESATEAAWDVGRLPILLGPTRPTGERPAADGWPPAASEEPPVRWHTAPSGEAAPPPPVASAPAAPLDDAHEDELVDDADAPAASDAGRELERVDDAAAEPALFPPPTAQARPHDDDGDARRRLRATSGEETRARIAAHRSRLERMVAELAELGERVDHG